MFCKKCGSGLPAMENESSVNTDNRPVPVAEAAAPKEHPEALKCMILGIVSLVLCWEGISTIAAIILAAIALSAAGRIQAAGQMTTKAKVGKILALVALIISLVVVAVAVIVLIVYLVIFVTAAGAGAAAYFGSV